jgi:KipI family sensor histidine kinase inhibitor
LSFPRVLPLGDAAVTLELGDSLDPATNARVRDVDRDLARAPFDGFRESVPTHRSLLVIHEPGLPFSIVTRDLLGRVGQPGPAPAPPRLHEVPTVYGGEHGADLAPLARRLGLTEQDVVRLHAAHVYTVFMLGFTPGFAYLGLLPAALESPRHATPRVHVPAGSVALAGRQTGIYPAASPGGWQILGRSALRLFDPCRPEPALLAPGDSVRFRPVPELDELAPSSASDVSPARATAVEVLDPGLLTSVQDAGRSGWRRIGVGGAGALDARALARANQGLGNPPGAAALECTLSGPTLLFHVPVRFALAGADLDARLERADLGEWPVPLGAAVLARPGNVLRFAGRRSGCRAIVAFEGGIDVPEVLGSRSTDLGSHFGGGAGRALEAGDRLALREKARDVGRDATPRAPLVRATVRVVLGPQADGLEPEALRAFLSATWRVGASSDRVGCRLDGPPLRHRAAAEILSDGMVPGSVQVPPDGRPIVMLADAPTTGGYPKLATVLTADLPVLAQLVPGEGELRFEAVALEDL